MLSRNGVVPMHQKSIKKVNADELVDIRAVTVDKNLPPEERMIDYLEQIKNPYCFRCGDAVVSVLFSTGGTSIDILLKNYFEGLKKG